MDRKRLGVLFQKLVIWFSFFAKNERIPEKYPLLFIAISFQSITFITIL